MKRILSFILILSIICGIPVFSVAKTPFFQDPDAIQQASESVLMLTCYDKDGNAISTGSGFLAFEDGIIVTNYHVVDGDVASVLASTEDGMYFDINDILCFDATADIAILKTKAKTRLELLKLGSSSSLKKGARVVAIGSPEGFLNTVSEGLYSGVYLLDTEYILFTAAISHGSSGGALFNEEGEVVGITAATWDEAQNLNFAIPIENACLLWEKFQSGDYIIPDSQANDNDQSSETLDSFSFSTVTFGQYEQNNIISDGMEDIEWLIIAIEEDKALLLSKYALDYKKFDDNGGNVTWESCSLRSWLNKSFINIAFTQEELNSIVKTNVIAYKNPNYNTKSGLRATDNIFLLSTTEIETYFLELSDRKCYETEYSSAISNSKSTVSLCWWWLRTPGSSERKVTRVDRTGSIDFTGNASNTLCAVRPAMWVKMSDLLP